MFDEEAKVIIRYHSYVKCLVNMQVDFLPNIIFNKYDVELKIDGTVEKTLNHGENLNTEFYIEPGIYTIKFINKELSSIEGEVQLDVIGDLNVGYKISCYSDYIKISTEYIENIGMVSENEAMISQEASDRKSVV